MTLKTNNTNGGDEEPFVGQKFLPHLIKPVDSGGTAEIRFKNLDRWQIPKTCRKRNNARRRCKVSNNQSLSVHLSDWRLKWEQHVQHAYIQCSAIGVKEKYFAALKQKNAYKYDCLIDFLLIVSFVHWPVNLISMSRDPTLHRCRTEGGALWNSKTEKRCCMPYTIEVKLSDRNLIFILYVKLWIVFKYPNPCSVSNFITSLS